MLKTLMGNIAKIESTILELDSQIAIKTESHQVILELLETIPGVGHDGPFAIIAEIGIDMTAFSTHKHLASWAGVSPGSNESAGKNMSGRITYGNKFLRVFWFKWVGLHHVQKTLI